LTAATVECKEAGRFRRAIFQRATTADYTSKCRLGESRASDFGSPNFSKFTLVKFGLKLETVREDR
jgi:hypothetical protein